MDEALKSLAIGTGLVIGGLVILAGVMPRNDSQKHETAVTTERNRPAETLPPELVKEAHELQEELMRQLPDAIQTPCREWVRAVRTHPEPDKAVKNFLLFAYLDWYSLTDKEVPSTINFGDICVNHPSFTLHQAVSYAYYNYK